MRISLRGQRAELVLHECRLYVPQRETAAGLKTGLISRPWRAEVWARSRLAARYERKRLWQHGQDGECIHPQDPGPSDPVECDQGFTTGEQRLALLSNVRLRAESIRPDLCAVACANVILSAIQRSQLVRARSPAHQEQLAPVIRCGRSCWSGGYDAS